MCSEFSGLPISCATPAASNVSAFSRSDSIVTSDTFVEPLADYIASLQPKQSASCIVQIRDPAFGIGHNDAFLDGIENRFQETFLLGQAQKIILHLFRPDAAESLDKFFKKTGFHDLKASNSNTQHRVNHQAPSFEVSSFFGAWMSAFGASAAGGGTSTVSISTRK